MAPTQAEVRFVQLKSCFVNVPQSVFTVLDNANAVNRIGLPAINSSLTGLGSPECHCRATIQRSHLHGASPQKTQWRLISLGIRWMDRDGQHRQDDIRDREDWETTERRDGSS